MQSNLPMTMFGIYSDTVKNALRDTHAMFIWKKRKTQATFTQIAWPEACPISQSSWGAESQHGHVFFDICLIWVCNGGRHPQRAILIGKKCFAIKFEGILFSDKPQYQNLKTVHSCATLAVEAWIWSVAVPLFELHMCPLVYVADFWLKRAATPWKCPHCKSWPYFGAIFWLEPWAVAGCWSVSVESLSCLPIANERAQQFTTSWYNARIHNRSTMTDPIRSWRLR